MSDVTVIQMKCVACHSTLGENEHGWMCECGGQLWDLARVAELGGIELRHALTEEAHNDPPLGRPCPRCRERFAVVHPPTIPLDGGHPEWAGQRVDVCLGCRLLWADPGELEQLDGRPSLRSEDDDHDDHHRPRLVFLDARRQVVDASHKVWEVLNKPRQLPRPSAETMGKVSRVLHTEIPLPDPSHAAERVARVLHTEINLPRPHASEGSSVLVQKVVEVLNAPIPLPGRHRPAH